MSPLGRVRSSPNLAVAIGVGLLSLGLSLWQLTVPGFLLFYDSGVYFAASLHLVSGTLPYRDFTFVQPPGILLLMSPLALLSRIIGSHVGFDVARVISAVVTALNASLLAWLVRHRGRSAMLIAGVSLALLPVACFVSTGLNLEPYLICFVLLGSLTIFSNDETFDLTTRQLLIGGVLFGAAASIKLWAFFPFVALVITLVPHCRRRVMVFIGAATAGFVALCLPFFLLAPRNFISQVFVEQLARKATETNDGGIIWRLIDMTGFSDTSIAPTGKEAVIAFVAFLAIVVVAYARRLEHERVDVYLLIAALISVAGLLVGPDAYDYYGYFTAPFLLGLLGICVARLIVSIRVPAHRARARKSVHRFGVALSAIVGAVIAVALIVEGTSFYSNFAQENGYVGYPISAISNLIPAGSCVVYDQVSYGMIANRLQATQPNCPSEVDAGGMWMAWGYHLIPPAPAFVANWKSQLEAAQYVVLSAPYASGIPWNQGLETWFNSNYFLLFGQSGVYIYEKS